MAQLPAGHVSLIASLLGWLRHSPPPIATDRWARTRASIPWMQHFTDEQSDSVRVMTAHFLHTKTITPLGGLVLDTDQQTRLAALCCLPLMGQGKTGLRGWSQVLVYPDAFRARRSHLDASGVMHEYDEDVIGESWEAGPLVLSWADVQAEIEDPWAGCCVIIHEMAHKLDWLDGVMDGTPPLPRSWQREWAADFQRTYDRFCKEVDAGDDTVIDPYASESPEEFFAVTSEYHFSAPALLQAEMPAVAAHLRRFYG